MTMIRSFVAVAGCCLVFPGHGWGFAGRRWLPRVGSRPGHHGASTWMAAESGRLSKATTPEFEAWAQSKGLQLKKAGIGSVGDGTGGGLGIIAKAAVAAGEVVAAVPMNLCLSAETARKSPIGRFLDDFEGWTGAAGLIALQLMCEQSRGASSPLQPWLDTLPEPGAQGALDLPLFWEQGQGLESLKGCSTRPIQDFTQEVKDDFAWLQENVFAPHSDEFPEQYFNEAAWCHAVGLAVSRSFFVDGATRLTPFLDFVNHDDRGNELKSGGMGMLGGKEVRLVASQSCSPGEEVCMSYGVRAPAEYLEEYGFVPARGGRSDNIAELVFEIGEGQRCYDDKLDILESAGLDATAAFELSAAAGGNPDPDMVQFLRLACLDGADLFLLEPVFRSEIWDFMALPVSEENEKAVGSLIIERCEAALVDMREAEKAATAGSPAQEGDLAASRQSLASRVREGEVKALETAVSWWKRDAEFLKQKEYYQERRLKALNLDKPWSPEDEMESNFSAGRAPGNVDWK